MKGLNQVIQEQPDLLPSQVCAGVTESTVGSVGWQAQPHGGRGGGSQSHRQLAKPFYTRVWVTLPPPESPLQLPQPPVQTGLSLNLAV